MPKIHMKPFGHSCRVVRAVRTVGHDRTYYQDTIEIHRLGSRKTLERAARRVSGFIRIDGEVEAYTADQWVRVFGIGNEFADRPENADRMQQPVRLSRAQLKVLRNLSEGLLAESGLHGRSEFGGHVSVMRSLRVRGLVDETGAITDEGRALFRAVSHG